MRLFTSFLFLFAFCASVSAQSCKSAPSVVSDLNRQISKILKTRGCAPSNFPTCLTNPTTYLHLTKEMVKYWNGRSSNWATIGPRRLDFGNYENGRIVSTGGRMYISCVPANKSTMTVDIKELDGKGKTSYVICKVDKDGRYTKLKTGWFNEVNSQKSNKRESRQHTLKGVKGHIISIHFDGKSAGNTFQYKVRVK
ncbi:hypothetical protein FUA23_08550 [Neolewinella aurantiaca]|uniref:Uncharacterized protein n=1 Tax=Neolewinella aurantiaca TaxID=2602767 RepID=A0A5C7FQC1_9BACT|nr:hypothetical protein [Neolewinella aurantiaca]TXF89992.1 hypothetical protein FUA23_08550 [Neolewinella aurantiaca]